MTWIQQDHPNDSDERQEGRFTVNRWLTLILMGLLFGCAVYHPRPLEPLKIEAELRAQIICKWAHIICKQVR